MLWREGIEHDYKEKSFLERADKFVESFRAFTLEQQNEVLKRLLLICEVRTAGTESSKPPGVRGSDQILKKLIKGMQLQLQGPSWSLSTSRRTKNRSIETNRLLFRCKWVRRQNPVSAIAHHISNINQLIVINWFQLVLILIDWQIHWLRMLGSHSSKPNGTVAWKGHRFFFSSRDFFFSSRDFFFFSRLFFFFSYTLLQAREWPIISGCEGPTLEIIRFVDRLLQPIA